MESITNITDAKVLAISSLLDQYQDEHVSMLLTLAHLQSLHNEHINTEGLPTANERFQLGIQFFVDLMTIATR